jgi:Fe-S oxidoreductase
VGVIKMNILNLMEQKYVVYRCIGCGVCKGGYERKVSPCPVWISSGGFEVDAPRGMITVARAIIEGKLNYTKELGELIFRCTACNNCQVLCGSIDLKTGKALIDPSEIIAAMKADMLEEGFAPPVVRDYLQSIYKYRNPWKEPPEKRCFWAKEAGVKEYKKGDEYLYFVDCEGSYDQRVGKAARALGELLRKAGLSFGILGEKEGCSGNEVNKLGEKGLFQYLAEENIKTFREEGVQKIVTLSPHAYNAIKNDYPKFNGNFTVMHYTQLLRDMIKSRKLDVSKGLKARVTFHDPCFLGRHNGEYEAPREVLKAIPGVELVEMERNKENSLCCGGGGGNFYTDIIGGKENSPARIRVREAFATGAEILVLACPVCMLMFEDAVKTEELEGKLAVKDIAEIVNELIV